MKKLLGISGLLGLFLLPHPASACGGLFCDQRGFNGVNFPVAQTGEGIVFAVDREEGLVHAVISVQYEGPASEFAWVLPLQSAPLALDVAPSRMFSTIDNLTAPRFTITETQTRGICADKDYDVPLGSEESLAFARDEVGAEAPAVQVISQESVGPYDSTVLASENPNAVRTWLEDNDYSVTDEMMEAVTPYITKGDTLLALRLSKSNDTGDIQPVVLTMEGDEVCVPIRLTAIAALEDMEITTTILSNEGRAIPENYNHVTLNLAKIDWMGRGQNYRQVVGQAADEGGGNAFTTEFHGAAQTFERQILGQRYDRGQLERTNTVGSFLQQLNTQGLLLHREIIGILVRHLPEEAFTAAGITDEAFRTSPNSLGTAPAAQSISFDPREAVDEIWDRIVDREAAIQDLFDQYIYATRLYTLISPDEMTIDPTFVFDSTLPAVTNDHTATMITECGIGGTREDSPRTIRIHETGEEIDARDTATRDALPAARRIEQLNEGRLIKDNVEAIADLLDSASSCTCATGHTGSAGLMSLLGVALMLFVRRRS